MSMPQLLVRARRDKGGCGAVGGRRAGTKRRGVVTEDNSDFRLTARTDIPIGHKVALGGLKEGDTVIKYGVDIGRMVGPAEPGGHVHVHNLKTKRW